MNREDILNKLKIIIDAQLACGENVIHEDETFKHLGADSLDNVELIMAIEQEFEIDIDDSKVERIKTVAQAIDYISGELA